LARGVYYTSPLEPPWEALAWAGVLMAGEGSGLAGSAAAHAWQLTAQAPTPITIRLPHNRRSYRAEAAWSFERSRVPFRVMRTPPRVGLERTVLDLCSVRPDQSAHWVTKAVGSGRTTTRRLRRELDATARHPARRELLELLADVGAGAHSPLELLYLRDVERAHGLPRGERQIHSGGYRIDVHYRHGLVVELDGRLGHEYEGRFRDMRRDNYHQLRGTTTLRFGWQDCQVTPCEVAVCVGSLLTAMGWTGPVTPCRRCRHVPEQHP